MPQFYTKDGTYVSFESAAEKEERLMTEADIEGLANNIIHDYITPYTFINVGWWDVPNDGTYLDEED